MVVPGAKKKKKKKQQSEDALVDFEDDDDDDDGDGDDEVNRLDGWLTGWLDHLECFVVYLWFRTRLSMKSTFF